MKRSLAILVVIGWLCAPAVADWQPGDGHKMHFPQMPDANGWDVNATAPRILADDWQCSQTGPVTDLHWWGSWRNGIEGTIEAFNIAIYSNDPGSAGGFSQPDVLLWDAVITNFNAVPIDPPSVQGWYDPITGQFIEGDHENYFQYNVFLDPSNWFFQQRDEVYWLAISAQVVQPDLRWGWKSSINHFLDDAVTGAPGAPWVELFEPPMFTESLDLAFVITPEPASLALLALGGLALLRRRR